MPKSDGRGRQNPASGLRLTQPDPANLLQRILETPHLEQVVPRLPPEVLHRVIQTCGLEDCTDLVAVATPQQLQRVFDLDVWNSRRPGLDEQLDAGRFGVWLDVLVDAGPAVAAEKIAGLDVDLVVAALAQHLRVFDEAAVSPFTTLDGIEVTPNHRSNDGPICEIGGYQIEGTRTDAWDSIVALLLALDAAHTDCFHRIMRGCRNLSNSTPEIDGLHDLMTDRDQDMFDLAIDREQRREKSGYVTPAQARAFLQVARQLRLGVGAPPPPNPLVRASLRAVEWTSSDTEADDPAPPAAEEAVLYDLLQDAGVLPRPPKALLEGANDGTPRLARVHALVRSIADSGPGAYATCTQELAYLANTLLAGCSVQARPFTEHEASEAVVAITNLGLENWPRHWPTPRDLVSPFQVGWTVLHDDVCMFAVDQLIAVLRDLNCGDREIQAGLDALRVDLNRYWRAGTPWQAREALDVLAILDITAWAGVLGLIDECPVMHAAIMASRTRTLAVSPTAFEFISENSQVASIREFLRSLPDALSR